ncbi:cysteine desulfurase NifS [Alkalicella caledoniensis]|uniref:Cysteine desulfurase IscS n=1 Tax=Alkalicella caledoniensis TaxID=2731377 RepID=A0A7G9W8Y4_ALKCA|nr:cysteine desulfurase NifS [Alkalicella caledoniensis]QNO15146.1 cysteine desulfurase NifS [Alkalicella caledoniensis]
MRRIYLDHAATTPISPKVLEAMLPFYNELFGNPSSIHGFGREVAIHVDKAREKVAKAIGAASPQEIYFTSGGTEADNLAIFGVIEALQNKGKHIITSAIEHHAVLDTCEALEKKGFEVTKLPVDENGVIDLEVLKKSIKDDTILITLMHANNEVGTIQPIEEVVKIAKEKGVYVHTDSVQTLGSIPVNVQELGVDLLSISAHKIYGPKGVGALYVKKGTKLKSLVFGGGQERKIRPGTENVAGIIGFGEAAEIATLSLADNERISKLRDKLIEGLLKIEDVKLNGHPINRLPGNVNVSIEYIEGEALLLSLDMEGIAASSGSACTSGSLDPSHVLMSMGLSHQTAHGSLRLTLGKGTTEEDIDYCLKVIPEVVHRLRSMSPLGKNIMTERSECPCTQKK